MTRISFVVSPFYSTNMFDLFIDLFCDDNPPYLRVHPMAMASDHDKQFTIPIFIHGDEGKHARDRAILIISMSGVLSHGPVSQHKFPILASQLSIIFVLCVVHYSCIDWKQTTAKTTS